MGGPRLQPPPPNAGAAARSTTSTASPARIVPSVSGIRFQPKLTLPVCGWTAGAVIDASAPGATHGGRRLGAHPGSGRSPIANRNAGPPLVASDRLPAVRFRVPRRGPGRSRGSLSQPLTLTPEGPSQRIAQTFYAPRWGITEPKEPQPDVQAARLVARTAGKDPKVTLPL